MFLERSCFLFEKMENKMVDLPILSLTRFMICCRVYRLNKSRCNFVFYVDWKGKNIDQGLVNDFREMFE